MSYHQDKDSVQTTGTVLPLTSARVIRFVEKRKTFFAKTEESEHDEVEDEQDPDTKGNSKVEPSVDECAVAPVVEQTFTASCKPSFFAMIFNKVEDHRISDVLRQSSGSDSL